MRNKPCYFLRSSGVNSFKEALLEFARKDSRQEQAMGSGALIESIKTLSYEINSQRLKIHKELDSWSQDLEY